MVTLSESVMKYSLMRPLAEKLRWKSYPDSNKTSLYRKPSITDKKLLSNANRKLWSLFQNPSYKKACSASWRKIMITSYPACNKTSLSRKTYIPDNKLIWNTIRKSWPLFQNPSWKIVWTAHGVEIKMASYLAGNKTSLSWKPYIPVKNCYGTLSGSHDRSFKIRHEKSSEAPPGVENTMTWYTVGNKTSLSRKPCTPDKKLPWITIMKSWSLSYLKNDKY